MFFKKKNDVATYKERKVKHAYHGMLDISVNPSLLWVHSDLDCKINRPENIIIFILLVVSRLLYAKNNMF